MRKSGEVYVEEKEGRAGYKYIKIYKNYVFN